MASREFTNKVYEYAAQLGGEEAYRARRLKCQTDLWFLSKEIFHRDLFERTHRPVINFFLKKKPFQPEGEYALADFHEHLKGIAPLEKRKGILLYPRGSYKSSIDADDITQWIICYPDIRVLVMVGESSLGESFVPDIKQRFVLEANKEPSEFQKLFPEFVIDLAEDKDRGGEQEYWSPARKLKQPVPTLSSMSILGSTSGWHCDVLKCDDVITDTTPVTEPRSRAKIVRKFVTTANLLDPHGTLELIGTRYHEEDLYDHVVKTLPECRYVCDASWTPLPHARLKKLKELTEQDILLLFPERQGFAFLREKLLLDEETFCLQQLNNPKLVGPAVKFRIEDLHAATIRVPQNANFRRYNFWDVATSDSDGSDYCAGGFLSVDPGKWVAYLHVLVMEKFTPSELAYQIAKLAKETNPERVLFEKYVATEQVWLEQEVRRLCVSMGFEPPIHAFKTDKSKQAKGYRICGLEPLIRGGRLFFSNLIPNIEMLYKQFTDFTGVPNNKRHDDGPDMLSFLRMVMPMTGLDMPIVPTPPMNMRLHVSHTNQKENDLWNSLHGTDAAGRGFIQQQAPQQMPVSQPRQNGEAYFPGQ